MEMRSAVRARALSNLEKRKKKEYNGKKRKKVEPFCQVRSSLWLVSERLQTVQCEREGEERFVTDDATHGDDIDQSRHSAVGGGVIE